MTSGLLTAIGGLFAHAGGFSWDEALLVLIPIAAVAGLLFLANARAKKLGGSPTDPTGADTTGDTTGDASGDTSGDASGDPLQDGTSRPDHPRR